MANDPNVQNNGGGSSLPNGNTGGSDGANAANAANTPAGGDPNNVGDGGKGADPFKSFLEGLGNNTPGKAADGSNGGTGNPDPNGGGVSQNNQGNNPDIKKVLGDTLRTNLIKLDTFARAKNVDVATLIKAIDGFKIEDLAEYALQ